VTADDFRKLALRMPEATESAHMGHPDFRVRNRIFATLSRSDEDLGMVQLTPEQQREFVGQRPEIFVPVKGGWGVKGATHVRLAKADAESAGAALTAAWRNVSAKSKAK